MNDTGIEYLTKVLESWKFDLGLQPLEKEKPRDLLYHYTTPDGLLGIFQSESIRATHVRYLNDRTELMNALSPEFEDLLLSCLFPKADEKRKRSLRGLRQGRTLDEVFVASFTDDSAVNNGDESRPGDRLSQWRAYSSPVGGFSLGFDSNLIMTGWKLGRPGGGGIGHLLRCRYSAREKTEAARRIGDWGFETLPRALKSCLEHFRAEVCRDPNQAELGLIQLFSDSYSLGVTDGCYLYSEAARFKHEAFSEEHEWRLVVQVGRQELLDAHRSAAESPIVHFRHGKFGVTPFINLPLRLTSADSPLRRVVVGPTQQEEEAVGAVKLLLESKGIKVRTQDSSEGVEVVPSQIPYRNW